MTDVKTSKESMKNFAVSWDKEVRNLWPTTYPKSLSNALKALKASSVLDAAGGTGYPIIELKEMGWDVSYADASTIMLDAFKQKIETKGLSIPIYHSRWEALSKSIPHTYDAVLCSGNSLANINSYDNDHPLTPACVKSNIQLAIHEFYKMLNTGGVLYIDLYAKEYAMPSAPYSAAISTDTHRIFRTISYDAVRHIRTNLTTTSSLTDGTETDEISKSIPIIAEDLIEFLLQAGFSRVERSNVDDADLVDSFFAFKD